MSTLLIRSFPSEVTQTGPRTLSLLLVPYDRPQKVADPLPGGKLDVYEEGFRRSVFERQVTSSEPAVVRRIGFKHAHEGGLGYLGPFVGLDSRDDGLYGDVSVLRSKVDDVADLLDQGVTGVSIEFALLRGGEQRADGVRWRTRARLDGAALEAAPAYDDARVLAFRAEIEDEVEDQLAEEADRLAGEEAAKQRAAAMGELDEFLAEERAKQANLLAKLGR